MASLSRATDLFLVLLELPLPSVDLLVCRVHRQEGLVILHPPSVRSAIEALESTMGRAVESHDRGVPLREGGIEEVVVQGYALRDKHAHKLIAAHASLAVL